MAVGFAVTLQAASPGRLDFAVHSVDRGARGTFSVWLLAGIFHALTGRIASAVGALISAPSPSIRTRNSP